MKDASAAVVFAYLKALARVREDSDLAQILGYSKQALSTARKRGKVSLKMLGKASIYFEKSIEQIIDEAFSYEFMVDAGPAGKYAYPVVQGENVSEKGKNENPTQSPEDTQTSEDTKALAANDLPSRLVQLRNGQARRAFAERMGTTESTLRNYEKGISIPTADFLRNICQILRISPEWLLFGETKSGNTGGQFFMPRALGNPLSCTDRENVLLCPGCVALDRVLQLERAERQSLAKENSELREELAQLKERLNLSGAQNDRTSVPMAHTG